MPAESFLSENVEPAALDAAVGPLKATLDDFSLQPERFEDLSTFVASQSADPHFRHDLEHPLGHRLSIKRDDLLVIFFFEHSIP